MIKVYAAVASVGFLVALTTGCSSADTPDDGSAGKGTGGGVVPVGGTPSGGTPSTTGGTPSGGTPSTTAGTGGTGGAATGGAATGGATTGAECKGIKTNMACTVEGTSCPALACGLADSGTRSCNCATTWMCTACDYAASPFKDKPADAPTCTVEADKVACPGKEGAVCIGAPGGEVCACWPDDEGSLIWDCDKPPSTWAAAAM